MNGIIYKWTNKTTGESYIGQTTRESERMYSHITAKDNTKFHTALRELGVDNFYYDVIEKDVPEDKLNERERYWISYYDSYKNGYNETAGGDCLWRDEKKKKKITAAICKAEPWKKNVGKKHTKEHNDNISKGLIGKKVGMKHSEETKHKISIASAGDKNGMYGKHHSQETKDKIAAAHTGKPSWNKGKQFSDEAKQHMSEAAKNRKHRTAEQNAAHGDKLRGRHRVYHEDGSYHYE